MKEAKDIKDAKNTYQEETPVIKKIEELEVKVDSGTCGDYTA